METAASSIISALGAGSGVNMAALANELAQAQFLTRIEQLSAKSDSLESKISTASALKNQIVQLAGALGDRVRTGDLAPTPNISNPSVATVSRSAASRPAGDYTLEVFTLASAQTLVGPGYPDASGSVGSGTLTLRFGSVSVGSFTADPEQAAIDIVIPSGATLSGVADAINASGAGVAAYVANSVDGARLVIKGPEGAQNGFVLEATEAPGDEGLAALAWEPTSGDPARLLTEATDAQFEVDGIAMSSTSNKVGDVAPGVSVTLIGTNAANPAKIQFNNPEAAIASVMQDLTGALNEIVAALNQATDPQTGDLARDDGARSLRRQLASLGSKVIMPNAADGAPATLAQLGMATNRDGSFSFNAAVLQEELSRDAEAVAAMFTNGLYGVYTTIDKIARDASTAGNPSSLAGSVNRYTGQQSKISIENTKIAEQQEALRARLTKQLTAADVQIGASQSTLSFLKAQVALWNKNDT